MFVQCRRKSNVACWGQAFTTQPSPFPLTRHRASEAVRKEHLGAFQPSLARGHLSFTRGKTDFPWLLSWAFINCHDLLTITDHSVYFCDFVLNANFSLKIFFASVHAPRVFTFFSPVIFFFKDGVMEELCQISHSSSHLGNWVIHFRNVKDFGA